MATKQDNPSSTPMTNFRVECQKCFRASGILRIAVTVGPHSNTYKITFVCRDCRNEECFEGETA